MAVADHVGPGEFKICQTQLQNARNAEGPEKSSLLRVKDATLQNALLLKEITRQALMVLKADLA